MVRNAVLTRETPPVRFHPPPFRPTKGAFMSRRFIVALYLACALPALPAAAQIVSKPDGQWRGALGAGLTATSGNSKTLTYSLNAEAVKRTRSDRLSGYAQAVYGRSDDSGGTERTSDLVRAGGAYNADFNERTFGFGAVELERDRIADLDLRTVVSAGVGYHVVKTEDHTFDVSTGPAYNRERFTSERRSTAEWLLAEESSHAFTSSVSFRQRLAVYANLDESGEYRAVLDAGFVVKVAPRWNATATLTNRYQSNPVPGIKKNDLLFVTGLQYAFNP
jgi:putative salt-induced outer membrane protein